MRASRIATIGADLVRLFDAGPLGPVDDAELLRRFVEGRGGPPAQAAFAAIVERRGGLVRGACRRVLRDSHAADDVAQAVFLVLARKARTIRCEGSLAPWLYGVAVRLALRSRSRSSRPGLTGIEGVEPACPDASTGATERAELMAAIDAEIARLPARDRAAVVLCHVEGLEHREAARRLRCPLGTLESRLHRARQRLRRTLARRGLAPAGGLALFLHGLRSHAAIPCLHLAVTTHPLTRRIAMKGLAWLAVVAVGFSAVGASSFVSGPRATAAPDEPPRAATPPAGPSVGDQIRAILANWSLYQQKHDVAQLLIVTKAQADQRFKELEAKFVECSAKLLPLIDAAPTDPTALDAMFWHVDQYWKSGTQGSINDQLVRSVDVVLRHYADNPRMAWRVLVSRNGMPTRLDDRLLAGLVASARRREPKGLALLALARYLEDKANFVIRVRKGDGPFYLVYANKSKTRPYDAAYEAALRSCDAAAIRREAEGLFERVVTEFGDVEMVRKDPVDPNFSTWVVPRPIGDEAAGHLAGLRGVAVGKPAPDLAWSNRDGSTSKLSDFRGKVVVLDFWRDGDADHRDFDRSARLARDMKGRPFVLIGFSARDPKAPPRFALPFARPDGTEAVPADGPIRDRLGVRRTPSTIVIDSDGILCFQCGQSILLDGYFRTLVEEAESRAARLR